MLKSIRLAAVAAALAFATTTEGAIFAPAAAAQAAQFAPWEAKIVKPGDLYSTPEWSTDIDAALKAAGQGGRLEEIKTRSNEKGWPTTMSDFDKRIESPEIIKAFKSHAIAKFKIQRQRRGDAPCVCRGERPHARRLEACHGHLHHHPRSRRYSTIAGEDSLRADAIAQSLV